MRTNVWEEHVRDVLAHAHTLTLAELGRKIPAADHSTLFRNVERLVKDGVVRKIIISQRVSAYELVRADKHHDHFVCDTCDEGTAIDMPRPKGLPIVRDVVVRGQCLPCTKQK